MKTLEQFKEINLNELNSVQLTELKNDVLSLTKDEIKEYVNHIADNIDFDDNTEIVEDNYISFLKFEELKDVQMEILSETKINNSEFAETREQRHKELVDILTKSLNECNTLEDFKEFPAIMYTSSHASISGGLDVNFLKEKLKEKLTDAEYTEYLEYFKTKYTENLNNKLTSQEKVNILMD